MKKSNLRFVFRRLLTRPGLIALLAIAAPLCFAVTGAGAQADRGPGAEEYPKFSRYANCVRDVSIDAKRGYDTASRWRAEGDRSNNVAGNIAGAMHCEALALSAMGVYPSAAKLLVRIAGLSELEDPGQKANLLIQAGHAFLLGEKPDQALEAFSSGLEHVSLETNPLQAGELHLGRARVRGLKEEWAAAISELNIVLADMPQYDEAILVRSSMHRAAGDLGAAAADLVNYLTLWPNDPPGLLERAFLRVEVKDFAGAKRDFERVVSLAPDSTMAARANKELGKLTFREESRAPAAD